MELDENRMDKRDDFSRKVGEKLREHQMPVAPDVWDALEKRLPKGEKRTPAYWPLAIAGVAAAFLALFLLLNPLGEEFNRESLHVQEISSPTKEMAPHEAEPMETREGEPKEITALNQGVDFEKDVKAERVADPEKVDEIKKVVDPDKVIEHEVFVESIEVDSKRGGVEPEEVAEPIEVDKAKETTPRSILLALASGDGLSGFPFGNYHGDESYYYDFAPGEGSGIGSDGGGDGQYNLLSPSDYTDIEHRPPVSFSLMAGFPLNSNLSIEAGLSYTYLYSRFNRNDRLVYRGVCNSITWAYR